MSEFNPDAPEVQEYVQKMVDEAVSKATEGLVSKNSEILGEKKKAMQELADLRIKQAEAEAKIAEASGDKEAHAEAVKKQYEAKIAEKDSVIDELSSFRTNALVDGGLMESLTAANVSKDFLPAAKALLRSDVEIVDNQATVKGEPLNEYVSKWAASDQGKHFVAAPANSGGNAPGGGSGSSGTTMNRTDFEKMATSNPQGVSKFFADGGTVVDE